MNSVLGFSQVMSLVFALVLTQHWQNWSNSRGCQTVTLAPTGEPDSLLYFVSAYLCSDQPANRLLYSHGNLFFILPISTLAFGLIGFIFLFGCGCEDASDNDTVVWDPVKVHQKMASVRKLTVRQVTESLSALPRKKKTEQIADFDHDQDYELKSHSFTSSDGDESMLQCSIFPDKPFNAADFRRHGRSLLEPQSAVYSKPNTSTAANLLVEEVIPEEDEPPKSLEVCDILCSRSALLLFLA